MTGKIHSLESFSKVDGPGIRYVVFMQGCNLRCKFCHNPDTWDINGGKDMQAEELVKTILKAKPYMDASNGGVTISGGEPLMQLPFLIELCKRLKEENIHVAIDTSGNINVGTKGLDELLKYVDLFLYDLKHIKPNEHKNLIGVDNKRILNLLEYVSNVKNIPVWIRIVYLPTITDKENSLEEYKKYLKTLKSIQKIEVLPYHEMGKYKWEELNLKYELNDMRIPSKEECKKIENYLKSN